MEGGFVWDFFVTLSLFFHFLGVSSMYFFSVLLFSKAKTHHQQFAGSRVLGAWSYQDSPMKNSVALGSAEVALWECHRQTRAGESSDFHMIAN